MIVTYIVFAALAIMLASLGGVLISWKSFSGFFNRNATLLTSFAVGIFAVVAFSLFRESVHEGLPLTEIFLWGLSGAVFLHMISYLMPEAHHHHDNEHDAHGHSRLDARRLLIGDAIHNIGDGIILVPAFLLDVKFGIITAIGVFLHELTQEIAEFFILREAGYSVRRALIYNFIVSSTILVGVGLGLNFSLTGESVAVLLSISAGGFLYVIGRDLLPDIAHVMYCNKRYVIYPFFIFLGSLTLLSVNALVPHAHGDSDHTNHVDHGEHVDDEHDTEHEDEHDTFHSQEATTSHEQQHDKDDHNAHHEEHEPREGDSNQIETDDEDDHHGDDHDDLEH